MLRVQVPPPPLWHTLVLLALFGLWTPPWVWIILQPEPMWVRLLPVVPAILGAVGISYAVAQLIRRPDLQLDLVATTATTIVRRNDRSENEHGPIQAIVARRARRSEGHCQLLADTSEALGLVLVPWMRVTEAELLVARVADHLGLSSARDRNGDLLAQTRKS